MIVLLTPAFALHDWFRSPGTHQVELAPVGFQPEDHGLTADAVTTRPPGLYEQRLERWCKAFK